MGYSAPTRHYSQFPEIHFSFPQDFQVSWNSNFKRTLKYMYNLGKTYFTKIWLSNDEKIRKT